MTLLAGFKRRWEKIRSIHRRHNVFYEMLGVAAILLVIIKIGDHSIFVSESGYHLNLFTDGVALAATVFLVDRFYRYRDKSSLQKRLIREAGSRSHDVAISAVEWMDREGWLAGDDGLLKGADLRDARLWDVRLGDANLQETIMERAVLCKASLKNANLRNADLKFAKLHGAKLNEAELQNAKCHGVEMPNARLEGACLEEADLAYACLEDAGLHRACLKSADLHRAKFKGAFLWDADFYDADLRNSEIREAEYHKEASWEKANFRYTDLNGVDFSDANMKEADLECADLKDAILDGTDLQGANLKGARLQGARLRRFDNFRFAYSGDNPPTFEDLSEDEIARKTNLLGATLPDGMVFSEEMDFSYLDRFIYEHDGLFKPMLAALDRYCNRP